MISVRRITNMDMLAETVAKPKGAVPKFGLPKWKAMSLEHKIPMIPNAPKDAYNFTRCKLGEKLWVARPKAEFDLSDPYLRQTSFAYEPLHDKHLLGYFSKPANIKFLLRADFITDDMRVKCTLRDYNTYRKYLRQIHVNSVKGELRRRNRLFVEQRALGRADDLARKAAKRQEKEAKVTEAKRLIAQQRKPTLAMQKKRERIVAQRLELSKLIKQEKWKLVNIRREERYEQLLQRRKLARLKAIELSKKWEREEKARAKAREKQLADIERQKHKDAEERWERKRDCQERDIAEGEMLLRCLNTRRQQFITDYDNTVSKERTWMERLLENKKLFINCYIRRYLPDGRRRVCCIKYLRTDTVGKGDKRRKESPTDRSREFVQSKEAEDSRRGRKPTHTQSERKHVARKNHKREKKQRGRIEQSKIQRSLIESKVKGPHLSRPKIGPTEADISSTPSSQDTRQCRCDFAKPK